MASLTRYSKQPKAIEQFVKDKDGFIIDDNGYALAKLDNNEFALVKIGKQLEADAATLLSKLKTKLKNEYQWSEELIITFEKDFKENSELLAKFDREEGLIESWKVLEKASFRTDPAALVKIDKWIKEGLDIQKLKKAFDDALDKAHFFKILENSNGVVHRRVLINDFENIPGVLFAERNFNGYAQGTVLKNSKVKDAIGNFDPDFDLSYHIDVMSFVDGEASLNFLKEGTKLYRVCKTGELEFTGGYWVRKKPDGLQDVIGGTAEQPEWNNYENIVEYTVPKEGIWVREGPAATQKLSNDLNISNPHLPGGANQVFIPVVYRRAKIDNKIDFRAINPNFSVNPLPKDRIP